MDGRRDPRSTYHEPPLTNSAAIVLSLQLARVEHEFTPEADDTPDRLHQFPYRHVRAGAEVVDALTNTPFHEENAGLGRIVHVQEFAPGPGRAGLTPGACASFFHYATIRNSVAFAIGRT